jgi:RNA polymerase primary sigma factor
MTTPKTGRFLRSKVISAPRLSRSSKQRALVASAPPVKRRIPSALTDRDEQAQTAVLQTQVIAPLEPSPSVEYSRPDALTLYLREAGRVPLLTPREEIALARRVQSGDEQAREEMIRANLRLVVKIAREYENLGLPLLDLINEGNIGLMKAVDRFKPDKGAKLSTYGALWIKQQIRRALASQGKTIRLPVHVADRIYHLRKAEAKHEQDFGRTASNAELAESLNIPLRRVSKLREAAMRPASLDAPLGDQDSSSIAEIIADENAVNPAQCTEDNDAIGRLRDLIARLPEREAKIIRARFGLDDGRERTLETIGARMGVTRERIRQLQQFALKKLREMLEQRPAVASPA